MKWSKYRSRVQCTLVKLEIILFKIGSLNLRFRHNNVTNISLPDGKTCSKNLNGVITSNSFFFQGLHHGPHGRVDELAVRERPFSSVEAWWER